MNYELLQGDCIKVMRTLPAGSVQMCCTSPPYLNLRSYLPDDHPDKALEIGTEQSVEEYVCKMVEVFREVRRLLHPSGVLFLNIGDSYNGSGGAGGDYNEGGLKEGQPKYSGARLKGLKPKDLIGVPWEVAFALRADGWYLRQELIWHKLAPMPESVTDRCTKAHEQVFLLAKSREYFFDATAIMEPVAREWGENNIGPNNRKSTGILEGKVLGRETDPHGGLAKTLPNPNGRNKRSVWTLGPEPYEGSHYAVMPTKLVEPCILAGSSARGCCSKCYAPWERVVEEERTNYISRPDRQVATGGAINGGVGKNFPDTKRTTTGWQPTCTCNADVIPSTVLDPFCGSGTTLAVALKFGRRAIGIDLDERNMVLVHDRIARMQPMLFEVTP